VLFSNCSYIGHHSVRNNLVVLIVESARNRNRLLKVNVRKSSNIVHLSVVVFAMLHRTVSPVSSVHLEQFNEGNNWDKG